MLNFMISFQFLSRDVLLCFNLNM